jgi:hypothetical protein
MFLHPQGSTAYSKGLGAGVLSVDGGRIGSRKLG